MTQPNIFADHAPPYWAIGIPVMPLKQAQKVPTITHWQRLAVQMPTPEEQERWMFAYPDGNIGLPLGPQSGIVALDLDNDDPKITEMILRLLPSSPWKRVGKKGAVWAYRFNGEGKWHIKDEDGKSLIDFLGRGAQVVLPPSIHPDTQRPYEANCDLLDVVDQLPILPPDLEAILRKGLAELGYKLTVRGATKITEWVPSGGRDSAMVGHAGLLARAVTKGERTVLEATHEIETWVVTYTEKVVGDLLDPKKARQKLLEFLRRDLVERGRSLPPNWASGLSDDETTELRKFFGEAQEDWSPGQFLDHLTERFAAVPSDHRDERRAIIEDALVRLAKNQRLTEMDREEVVSFIKHGSGMAVGPIRERLKRLMKPQARGESHAEIAELVLSDLEAEGQVRFADSLLYRFAGSHWVPLDDTKLIGTIAREFGDMPAAKKAPDHRGILATLKSLRVDGLVAQPGVNFANGFLTPDLQLLPHDRAHGATYVLGYRYLPEEHPPTMFLEHLERCWGDDPDFLDKVEALREAIAATMFGVASRYQRAICLYGVPHSGKSVIVETLLGLLSPDAMSAVPPHDWDDKFLPTQMNRKVMNFCGELSDTQLIEGDRFKTIVEGGTINGQLKGGQIFKFDTTCAQWFATNHLPRSRDGSGGFTRRWMILRFNKACPPEQKRVHLAKEILAEEREAIVAWALPAIRDLTERQDYTLPASHHAALGDMATLNNSIRHFLTSSQVNWCADASWEETHLYMAYFTFSKRVRSEPMQLTRFRVAMLELQHDLGFSAEPRSQGETIYRGLGPVRRF